MYSMSTTNELNGSPVPSSDISLEPSGSQIHHKRKADSSPVNPKRSKRKVFVIVKNNVIQKLQQLHDQHEEEEQPGQQPQPPEQCVINAGENTANNRKEQDMSKTTELGQALEVFKHPNPNSVQPTVSVLPVPGQIPAISVVSTTQCRSSDTHETERTFYISAYEDPNRRLSVRLSNNFVAVPRRLFRLQQIYVKGQRALAESQSVLPAGVEDFDRMHWHDPLLMGNYAKDIFNYLKSREKDFVIVDYMPYQVNLTRWMRTLLIDWMLEVQDIFELSHDTLYLAVKVVDLYLCRKVIKKEQLQLLGAAAYFLACKYDDRQVPLIKDFLYVCDGAYNRNELIKMEQDTLCTINFELGIPLAYRFLCRYARCAKIQVSIVTLARFILEMGLLDYVTITHSDSKMAAASLFIALRMTTDDESAMAEETWSPTLIYYSGYELADFVNLVTQLNTCLRRKSLPGIHSKYSEKLFFEVNNVPVLSNAQLLSKPI